MELYFFMSCLVGDQGLLEGETTKRKDVEHLLERKEADFKVNKNSKRDILAITPTKRASSVHDGYFMYNLLAIYAFLHYQVVHTRKITSNTASYPIQTRFATVLLLC